MNDVILVSSCLAGVFSRYNGSDVSDKRVIELIRRRKAVPLCAEQMGGLCTPRVPCERRGDRVYMQDGRDVTEEFVRGADEAVRLAELYGCTRAVLKSGSPTCGSNTIYDGSFTGVKIPGDGVLAERLKAMGVEIRSELDDLSDWLEG